MERTAYDPDDFAPEVHSPNYPEVVSPNSPEVVQDPHTFYPELSPAPPPETICFPLAGDASNAPENLHHPNDVPPEVVLDQAPEVRVDDDSTNEKALAIEHKLNEKVQRTSRRWAALVGFVLICAAVGGSVGGVSKHKSRFVEIAEAIRQRHSILYLYQQLFISKCDHHTFTTVKFDRDSGYNSPFSTKHLDCSYKLLA